MGPYSLEELKTRGLSNETLVWAEGMEEWVRIEDLKEVQEKLGIKPIPPRIPIGTRLGFLIKNCKQINILFSFLIGIHLFLILFVANQGLDNLEIYLKWKKLQSNYDYSNFGFYKTEFNDLYNASIRIEPKIRLLSNTEFGIMNVHENNYKKSANILILPSIIIAILSFLGLQFYEMKHEHITEQEIIKRRKGIVYAFKNSSRKFEIIVSIVLWLLLLIACILHLWF